MITRLYIDNFRTLVDFEIKFDRTTLLMGPNGGGKSSILDVLRRLRQFNRGEGKAGSVFSNRDLSQVQLEHRDTQRFELDVKLSEGEMRYVLVIEFYEERSKCRVKEESLSDGEGPLFERKLEMVKQYRDDHGEGPAYPYDWSLSALSAIHARPDNKKLTAFRRLLDRLVIAAISPSQMETRTREGEDAAVLSSRMENFVSWYLKLSHENMGSAGKLFDELRLVLPDFSRFIFKDVGQGTKAFIVEFNSPYQPRPVTLYFSELSDGQRVLIALYTLVYGLGKEGLCIFLDEPDNFVMLREIQPWLAALLDKAGENFNQAVIISHHPECINYLGNTRGRWLSRGKDGLTRIKEDIPVDGKGLALSEIIASGWVE